MIYLYVIYLTAFYLCVIYLTAIYLPDKKSLTNFAQAFYYADFPFVKALTFPQFRKKSQTSWKYLEI